MSKEVHIIKPFSAPDPAEIPDIPVHEFILQKVEKRISESGDTIFLKNVTTGQTISCKEVLHKVRSIASGLRKRGFEKGDVFCIYTGNIIEYHVVTLSVWACGGCLETANSNLTTDGLLRQIRSSGVKMILCDQETVSRGLEASRQCETLSEVFVTGEAEGCSTLASLTSDDGSDYPSHVEYDPDVVIFLPFSSGTTGEPKGIMHTNRTLLTSLYLSSVKERGAFSWMMTFWFFHLSGFLSPLAMLVSSAITTHFMSDTRESKVLEMIQEYKPVAIGVYPQQLHMLAKSPLVNKYDVKSVKLIICGGAILLQNICREIQEKLNAEVAQSYGMTECGVITSSPILCITETNTRPQLPVCKEPIPASVGVVTGYSEVKVIDLETGEMLGPNKEGEICVRTPACMKGYLDEPQETAEVMDEDGFFHTGDLGYYDDDFCFYVTDRLKDMLKFKAHQGSLTIPTRVLETILLNHSAVKDVAVIGTLDSDYVEVPQAYVVLKDNIHVTEEELIQHVDSQVQDHMKLRGGVVFIDSIPVNKTGKKMKYYLKKSLSSSFKQSSEK